MKKLGLSTFLVLSLFLHSVEASNLQTFEDLREEIGKLRLAMQATQSIPSGSTLPFAGTNAPDGWLMCNGQIVSRHQYVNLYNVIGRTYTPLMAHQNIPLGDDLFCVPDMRGRIPVGVDNGTNRVISNNTLGTSGGEESHQLIESELASHSHPMQYTSSSTSGGIYPYFMSSIPGEHQPEKMGKTSLVGGSQPHNNMQPYLVLNYIIKY